MQNRQHVRMHDCCRSPCFPGKSFPGRDYGCQMRGHHLDSDQAILLFLKAFEYDTVRTLPDKLADFYVSQSTERFRIL